LGYAVAERDYVENAAITPRSVGAILDYPFEAILAIDPLISRQY
jgi:hypothetical protein